MSHNPHDSYFKLVFGNLNEARSFITHYLPIEIVNNIDINSLEHENTTFIDQDLSIFYSDVLYKCMLKSGQETYLYFLIDHKSYPDTDISLQLLNYMVKIWMKYRENNNGTQQKLPLIIPIVFYHGKQEWKVGLNLLNLINCEDNSLIKYVPNYEYVLSDINKLGDEQIEGTIELMITLLLMKHINDKPSELFETIKKILPLIEKLYNTKFYQLVLITDS